MSTPLTRHIKTFDAGTFPSEEILQVIGRVLKNKMWERKIWDQPPSFLGYPEYGNWNDDASFFYSDIVIDCYEYAVLSRFQSLKTHVSKKDNIDGLVFLNISHFLQDRQQAHDPLGYAVFKNVEAILKEFSKSEFLMLDNLRDKNKIRNETTCLLVFPPTQAPFPDYNLIKQTVSSHSEYETILCNAVILGDRGQRSVSLLILHLKKEGIAAFRVKDLVDVLKKASRSVDTEILSSDVMEDFHIEVSDLSVSHAHQTEAAIDAAGLQEKIKREIDKLKNHNKVKKRYHLLLTVIFNKVANDEDVIVTEIAREMGESPSTISEDWALLRSLVKNE